MTDATTGTSAAPRTGVVGVGIIGAGVISTQYLENLTRFPDVEVRFIADLDLDRARSQAELFGVAGHGSVDELLAQDDIEIVVNLTIPAVHTLVGEQIVAAGKHVWSEKPIALDRQSGRALLASAAERGLRVACAPDTFLGAGLQTVQRLLESGRIGTPLTALAIMQSPGPEDWHPNPEFLFDIGAGPLFDIGPYYITALVQQFGPVASVSAVSSKARATRTIGSGPKAGTDFDVNVPTQHSAILSFEGGASAVLLLSFESQIGRALIEYTGVDGSLESPDPNTFDGTVTVHARGEKDPDAVPSAGAAFGRGQGVLDLARSIRAGVPERAAGELAFHVLDVMVSIAESAEAGAVEVTSTAVRPEPLAEDWDPTAATLSA